VPFAVEGGIEWRMVEEFDTSRPVVTSLPDDYFADIVTAFVKAGHGTRGTIGAADSVLVDAPAMCAFAVRWLEQRLNPTSTPASGWRDTDVVADAPSCAAAGKPHSGPESS
jgi:hypothetical protein